MKVYFKKYILSTFLLDIFYHVWLTSTEQLFCTALMNEAGIIRQISSDSVGSVNSLSSACSVASHKSSNVDGEQKKITKGNKKGWVSISDYRFFAFKPCLLPSHYFLHTNGHNYHNCIHVYVIGFDVIST